MTVHEDCRDLLLREQLSDDRIHRSLSPVGFADCRTAHRRLLRMADGPQVRSALADLLPHLLTTLTSAADPDRVLVNLERFAQSAANRLATLQYLASNPRAVEILATLFAGSQFLTEILLRNPEYLTWLMEHKRLALPKSVEQLTEEACASAEAQAAVASSGGTSSQLVLQLDALRRFQRWELLRIGACDLLGLFDLPAVTGQLSNLADSLVRACLSIVAAQSIW